MGQQANLTQTKTISRYADPMQKKLALALLNRTLSPEFLEPFGEEFLWRPDEQQGGHAHGACR